ncbi:MAG: multicopper oxidase domain-containing protein [Candidatus Thiodiazotropha sp. (ex. Lucinisca nassula)]|nr:multicopper oxidase domain-containing protein [Candidatus Thiodiazotropha sp. (ex. Lucinisca nassula)]MBW9270365.1 multicopper oxidase domain-containing protein [Candidatus Thiodiazotropha sp. (ex. Lucinisca nassula)]
MNKYKLSRLSLAVIMGAVTASGAQAHVPGGTLNPNDIPKYVTPLVIPPVMNDTGIGDDYDIGMRQFKQQILPGGIWNTLNGRNDSFPPTTVWSYGPATDPRPDSRSLGGGQNVAPAPNSQFNYPAYTIEALKDTNTSVDWINQLVRRADRCRAVGGNLGTERANDCNFIKHILPVDQTLHWANPKARCDKGELRTDCHGQTQSKNYNGPVPIVTHVHGAHTGASSDGYTEGWWLPNASNISCVPRDVNGDPSWRPSSGEYVCEGTIANLLTDRDGFNDQNIGNGVGHFEYLNDQPSATLWYHDHALGMTRLNVYAGPAGFWLVRDPSAVSGETGLQGGNLPGPAPIAGEDLVTTNFPADMGGSREKYREIPVVIQDRSFNADGSLWYPDNRAFFDELNVEGTAGTGNEQYQGAGELQIKFSGNNAQDKVSDIAPIWNPEAFFNTMVVNGTTWPELEVAPSLYRFRLLNGTNARWLSLSLPIINPTTEQKTSVIKDHWYREVNTRRGGYKGPWTPYQVPVDELFMYQIGTEQALLPKVVAVREGKATQLNYNPEAWAFEQMPYMEINNQLIVGETDQGFDGQGLLIGPAERADVIVDFRGLPDGTVIRMLNNAPDSPFGGFPADELPDADTTGQVMQFVVNHALLGTSPTDEDRSRSGRLRNPDTAATSPWDLMLTGVESSLPTPSITREMVLLEEESKLVCVSEDAAGNLYQEMGMLPPCDNGAVPHGPQSAILGTIDAAGTSQGQLWSDPISTNPAVGAVEDWKLYNFSADAHPIHVHLVKHKVMGREAIGGGPSVAVGTPNGLEAWEYGWKDTVNAYPGDITTIRAEFDLPGLYVWHCHIVEHEDNEMMVPFCVGDVCPDKLF